VAADVGAPEPEHGRTDETDQADADRREQRLSQDTIISDSPSPFVVEWLPRVAADIRAWRPPSGGPIQPPSLTLRPGKPDPTALDLAMGRGRHARFLARAGFRTFGVDMRLDAVRDGVRRARADGLVVRGWCADLTQTPLPRAAFDVVVVTRYLQRDLFPSIRDALKTRGAVLYETFTVNQRRLGFGPTSSDHLLQPGELRQLFDGFDVVFYEEVLAPEAVARIVARKS